MAGAEIEYQEGAFQPVWDPYDYVSPNLTAVDASAAFPDLAQGDSRSLFIDGMETPDPHRWYYDRRQRTGFLNRDEATLIYNLALPFAGKRALEIGCASGYSSWHLLKAGLELMICDPVLQTDEGGSTVEGALAEFRGKYVLIGLPSPDGVRTIGQLLGSWSFAFIDGNHDAPQPIIDAAVARHYCTPDAMIVFHDALLRPVFEAMVTLVAMGWKARFYHTSQGVGCCWQGNVAPVEHTPDAAIMARPRPDYLKVLDAHG